MMLIIGSPILLLFIYLASAVHELGHLIGAFLGNTPIRTISFGTGKRLLVFSIRTIDVEIRLFPGGGLKTRYTTEEYFSSPLVSRLFLTLGGISANFLIYLIITNLPYQGIYENNHSINFIRPLSMFYKLITIAPDYLIGTIQVFAYVNMLMAIISSLPIVKIDLGNAIFSILDRYYPTHVSAYLKTSRMLIMLVSWGIIIMAIIDIALLILKNISDY